MECCEISIDLVAVKKMESKHLMIGEVGLREMYPESLEVESQGWTISDDDDGDGGRQRQRQTVMRAIANSQSG